MFSSQPHKENATKKKKKAKLNKKENINLIKACKSFTK